MNDGLIPRRYAKALYKLALETGETSQLYEQLKPLARGIKGLDSLKSALLDPEISDEQKGASMSRLIGAESGGSLDRFILLVIRRGRVEYLRKIALAYLELYRDENNIAKVEITTATEMPRQQIDDIVNVIRKQFGQDITLEVETAIDPSLIGGFAVKIGDLLLDASVKNELNKLRLELHS